MYRPIEPSRRRSGLKCQQHVVKNLTYLTKEREKCFLAVKGMSYACFFLLAICYHGHCCGEVSPACCTKAQDSGDVNSE